MALNSKSKHALEQVAGLKVGGVSAAEASSAIQSLDAVASDVEVPNSVRSMAVHHRDALLQMATPSAAAKRETVMAAVAAFASANT